MSNEASPTVTKLTQSPDGLQWLDDKPYPRFYWKSRDNSLEIASSGRHRSFSLPHALAYTQANPRVLLPCVLPFEKKPAAAPWRHFSPLGPFLPQLALVRKNKRVTIQQAPPGRYAKPNNKKYSAADGRFLNRPCSPREYRLRVQSILSDIEQDKIIKTVLARRSEIIFPCTIEPARFIRAFTAMGSPAFLFFFSPEPGLSFIGSSPERLFCRRGRTLQSEALAGTRPRGSCPVSDRAYSHDLRNSAKDRREHRLVLDFLRRRMTGLCTEITGGKRLTLRKLTLVQHLYSTLRGKLRDSTDDQALLRALHPTPAVAGLPVRAACRLIKHYEGTERGLYAGPLGVLSRNYSEFCVAIRSALLSGRRLSIFAGAGIVAGSQPEEEWLETEQKAAAFRTVLQRYFNHD